MSMDNLTDIASTLTSLGLTIATAESCTGGRIAARMTSIPGASAWMRGGVVSYATPVKQQVLGVDIAAGVVSEATALQMAMGAARLLEADCAIATTGVAGPSGGTAQTPVGTVCIAAVIVVRPPSGERPYCRRAIARTFHFDGNRESVVLQAVDVALAMVDEIINSES